MWVNFIDLRWLDGHKCAPGIMAEGVAELSNFKRVLRDRSGRKSYLIVVK